MTCPRFNFGAYFLRIMGFFVRVKANCTTPNRSQAGILLAALLFVGCQGIITKHNYTEQEILDIAKFAGTSQENVRKYLSGNATISDVGNSALRIDTAVKYIKAKQAP